MLKFTYEQIVDKIKSETQLTKEEIEFKIKNKVEQLSDLISKEGAAHIVANQLGVKLLETVSSDSRIKIKDIPRGLSGLTTTGKVIGLNKVVSFNKNGRSGRVVNFTIADDTASIRVVVWDEVIINEIEKNLFKLNDIVKLRNAYSKENNGFTEIHLGGGSQIQVNPEGINFDNVAGIGFTKLETKTLDKIEEGEYIGALGTIVQFFEPRFFNVCTKCNKKVYEQDGNNVCKEHGITEIKKSLVFNFFFDDGTNSLRVVSFGDTNKKLIDYNDEDLESYSLPMFDVWRKEILGKQVLIEGKVTKNELFNRLELVARNIKEVDPSELLKDDV